MAESANRDQGAHGGQRALVVRPEIRRRRSTEQADRPVEARLDEAVGLARAINLDVVHREAVTVRDPRPATLLGSGTVEALGATVKALDIALVVVDSEISPIQQRNLERAWECKVIDRTALILEIFGERAQTREGSLQVELAHLTYQRSRLVRSWTHLERQRGGFGFLGGPGETQIEIDRRLIGERIQRIKKDLADVTRTRGLQRRARKRVPYAVIALVGYTNAGKSTLFNRLTQAEVVAQDMLFATLDPTMRSIELPSGRKAILSDTVGFISELPTDLVAAFRATLEEVISADVVVHVRDIAHPETESQRQDVIGILRDLGLGARAEDEAIEALNKIDLLQPAAQSAVIAKAQASNRHIVPVSALTGEGCDRLLETIERVLAQSRRVVEITLKPWDGADLAWLYDHGEVLSRNDRDDAIALTVSLDEADITRFEQRRH